MEIILRVSVLPVVVLGAILAMRTAHAQSAYPGCGYGPGM